MTNQEGVPAQIYVPALHRELVRAPLPATVLFLDPGLPLTVATPGLYHPPSYPFSPENAARVLDELLAVGETLDAANIAAGETALALNGSLSEGEKADIARFAASSPAKDAHAGQDAKIAAHKVLLLAWDLENRLAEIAALRQEVAEAVKPLAANLHGPGAEDDTAARDFARAMPDILPEALADLPETMEPDWRLALSAIAAFIPANAVLVTRHEGMRVSLLEAGMLHPLPEDTAEKLAGWPEEERSRMLWAKLPLWRILGRPREPENVPWLLAAPELIICPAKGWDRP